MQDIGSHLNHFIRLNLPARADIMGISSWKSGMVCPYSGILVYRVPNLQVYINASGTWGCRVFLDPRFHV